MVDVSDVVSEGPYLPYEGDDVAYYALVVAIIIRELYYESSSRLVLRNSPHLVNRIRIGYAVLSRIACRLASQGGRLLQTVYTLAGVVDDSDYVYRVLEDVIRDGNDAVADVAVQAGIDPVNLEEIMPPHYIAIATTLLRWLSDNGWLKYVPWTSSYTDVVWDTLLDKNVGDVERPLPPPFGVRLLHAIIGHGEPWWRHGVDVDSGTMQVARYQQCNIESIRNMVSVLSDDTVGEMYRFLMSPYPYSDGQSRHSGAIYDNNMDVVLITGILVGVCLMLGRPVRRE